MGPVRQERAAVVAPGAVVLEAAIAQPRPAEPDRLPFRPPPFTSDRNWRESLLLRRRPVKSPSKADAGHQTLNVSAHRPDCSRHPGTITHRMTETKICGAWPPQSPASNQLNAVDERATGRCRRVPAEGHPTHSAHSGPPGGRPRRPAGSVAGDGGQDVELGGPTGGTDRGQHPGHRCQDHDHRELYRRHRQRYRPVALDCGDDPPRAGDGQ